MGPFDSDPLHDVTPAASVDLPTPAAPPGLVASPEVWRAIVAVLMEAPVPGRIVAPLTNLIEKHLAAQGLTV